MAMRRSRPTHEAFKNPRDKEYEEIWHGKAASRRLACWRPWRQWNDASSLYLQLVAENGPRAAEAKARLSKLKLENFLWEN